jgi:hypothetical protein
MAQKSRLLIAGLISAFVLFIVGGAIAAPGLRRAGPESGAAAAAQGGISGDRALVLAIKLVPGSIPTRDAELVNFQGTPAYEVVLNSGTVYVDAQTGAVLASSLGSQAADPATRSSQPGGPVLRASFDGDERGRSDHGESRSARRGYERHDDDDDD